MSSTRSTGQSNVYPHPRKSRIVYRFCCQRWTGKMQSMGCFRGPANEEKEPHLTKIAALSIFACNSSIMAGTIAEDDYKDNNGLEDGLKVRDGLIGRIATEFISRRHSIRCSHSLRKP